MKIFEHESLNLYSNYAQAARNSPDTRMVFDEVLRAFPEYGLTTTYAKSLQTIKKRAYQLATIGIQKGDKVLIYKSPAFDTYLLAVSVTYLGAVPVMVSYHLPPETIEVFVDRLEHPYILFDEQTKDSVKMVRRKLTNKLINSDTLIECDETVIDQQFLSEDDISYMTHTSGTTGIPKLICHSANSMGWRTAWQKSVMTNIDEKRLVGFHISPVHSRYNIGVSSLMSLGFPIMPLTNPAFESIEKMMVTYRPIAVETHPNHFVQWTRLAKDKPEIFAQTKYYHSTFDAINNGTMRVFLEASEQTNPVFLQVYGQSECGPMIIKANTLETLETSDARDMGVGFADLTQARICDHQNNELPANVDGHIQFLSKGRALTYYKEDERFQRTTHGLWWDSGDYGCMDGEGHVFLKDRQVDLIDEIGSTLAIEDYLLDQLDFLEEVVLVRAKDQKAQPILAVSPGKEMNWDMWWEKVSDLPHLHYPILRKFEDIPHTATMKVQRLELEKELLDE